MTDHEKEKLLKLIREYGKELYLSQHALSPLLQEEQKIKYELTFDKIKELLRYEPN
jgi:hypothetical protein